MFFDKEEDDKEQAILFPSSKHLAFLMFKFEKLTSKTFSVKYEIFRNISKKYFREIRASPSITVKEGGEV